MMEAVHRYEGTVSQGMGDGIMALFGAPIAHEDNAIRACYAALRMQDAIGRYTEEDFFRALREGKRPAGTPLDSLMPYRFTRQMSDDEIRALYLYLRTVPPKPYGTR